MSILEVRDVSIIYSDDKRVAVEHASFKIEAGEYACIIGSNGSGKSTLVKGIVGLVPVTSGEVIHALSPEQYAYLSQITEIEIFRQPSEKLFWRACSVPEDVFLFIREKTGRKLQMPWRHWILQICQITGSATFQAVRSSVCFWQELFAENRSF